jgi:PadR family transcriptional regulator PadR
MQVMRDARIGKDLVAASAMPLVLAILNEGDSYGYAIQKRIDELSGGQMEWTDGMLYPLLHRLDRLGYVEAAWDSPPGGRRRRYYRITAGGRKALSEQRRQWEVVASALKNAWHSVQLPDASLPTAEGLA